MCGQQHELFVHPGS